MSQRSNRYGRNYDFLVSDECPVTVTEHRPLSTRLNFTQVVGNSFFGDPATGEITVQYILDGSFDITATHGGDRFAGRMRKGSFVVTHPEADTMGFGHGAYRIAVLAFGWPSIRPTVEEAFGRKVPHLGRLHDRVSHDPTIDRLVQLMVSPQREPLDSELFYDSLGVAMMTRLLTIEPQLSEFRASDLSSAMIDRIHDYVVENLNGTITLEQLAAIPSISPFHFVRVFKRSTGSTPYQFVLNARLDAASDLLRKRADLTVGAIAAQTGFADQSHLSRHLKGRRGVTPAQLRDRDHD